MAKKSVMRDVATQAQNRRSFVRKLAVAGAAGAAVLGMGREARAGGCSNDEEILQFLLNIEFLQAEFYTMATTGKTIDEFGLEITGAGDLGPTTGGQIVHDFNRGSGMGILLDIANQLAADERNHVLFLQEALSYYYTVTPIAKPAINLNALGYGLRSSTEFVQVARMLEDIAISAWAFALDNLEDEQAYTYGLRVIAAQGEHAGSLRAQAGALSVPSYAMDCNDVPTPPAGYYFSTNQWGLPEWRYPDEVLYLLYGSKPNANSGGFYPDGTNGIIYHSSKGSCD